MIIVEKYNNNPQTFSEIKPFSWTTIYHEDYHLWFHPDFKIHVLTSSMQFQNWACTR